MTREQLHGTVLSVIAARIALRRLEHETADLHRDAERHVRSRCKTSVLVRGLRALGESPTPSAEAS